MGIFVLHVDIAMVTVINVASLMIMLLNNASQLVEKIGTITTVIALIVQMISYKHQNALQQTNKNF